MKLRIKHEISNYGGQDHDCFWPQYNAGWKNLWTWTHIPDGNGLYLLGNTQQEAEALMALWVEGKIKPKPRSKYETVKIIPYSK